MKTLKTTISFISAFFIIFLLTSVWSFFYIKNKIISLLLSLILTVSIYLILNYFSSKTNRKKSEIALAKKDILDFKIYLSGLDKTEFNRLIKNIFKERVKLQNSQIILDNKILIINAINENLNKKDILLFCNLAQKKHLTKIAIFNFESNENLVLFSNSISNFEIEFVPLQKVFELAKANNICYENIIKYKNKTKFNLKLIFNLIFSRKNAKIFFLFGILNYISSFLTIFRLYYIISTTAFFTLSLICLFRPKEQSNVSIID